MCLLCLSGSLDRLCRVRPLASLHNLLSLPSQSLNGCISTKTAWNKGHGPASRCEHGILKVCCLSKSKSRRREVTPLLHLSGRVLAVSLVPLLPQDLKVSMLEFLLFPLSAGIQHSSHPKSSSPSSHQHYNRRPFPAPSVSSRTGSSSARRLHSDGCVQG